MVSGSAFAAQLSKTDGTSIEQTGGTYSSVSATPNGTAVYASNSSTIIGNSLIITDSGYSNYAPVYVTSGGEITLSDNSTISGNRGLHADKTGSQIIMNGGSITATGNTAVDVYDGAAVTLNNVNITAANGSWGIIVWSNDASLALNGSTLNVSGNTVGMQIQSGGSIRADGLATTSNATGVLNSQGNLDLKNFAITTQAANAYGVNANIASTTILNNGTITTAGSYANGIWAVSASYVSEGTTVTGDHLTIRTTGSNAHGVLVSGDATNVAQVTLTNTTVETVGAFGLYADSKGKISLSGGSITTTGNGAVAVITSLQDSSITLNNVDLKTSGTTAFGIRAQGNSSGTATFSTISMKNGKIETSGVDGYAVTATYGGKVTLENVNASTTGANGRLLHMIGNAGQTNTIDVTGGVFRAENGLAISARGSNDTLSLTGATVSGNGTLLDVAAGGQVVNPAYFTMNVDSSTLTGGARVDAASRSNIALNNSSTWTLTQAADGTSDSAVSNLSVSNSTIAFAAPTSGTFQTLTVGSGDPGGTAQYVANGATLRMNTYLNGGGALSNQQTDRLLINGDVSGTTMVGVVGVTGSPGGGTSLGGSNLATEGISLIQASGNSTESSFQLLGGYTTLNRMPYQYRLYAYGPGAANGEADASQRLVSGSNPYWDYRLQSVYIDPPSPDPELNPNTDSSPGSTPTPVTPSVRAVAPQVPAYIVAPTALFQAGLQDISNLHSRLGEIRDDRAAGRNGGTGEFFMRAYGGKYNYASNRNASAYGYDANIDYAAVQMGGNLYVFENASGITRFGIAGTIGSLSFDPKRVGYDSSGSLDTWSVAAYATYLHNSGWYVDGIVSFGAFDGHVSTNLRGRTTSLSGKSFSASIETGYPIALGNGLVLEPQAQLVYQRLMFDRKEDVDNFTVNLGNQDQLTGRLGARLSKTFNADTDKLVTLYAKANVLHGIVSGGKVFLGDNFRLGRYGTAVEARLGVSATLSKNLSLYADAAYQHKVGKSGVSGVSINGGLRYSF